MQYVIELDLIPIHMSRCSYPMTRRFVIEAPSISEAMSRVVDESVPGQDCVAVRILECNE